MFTFCLAIPNALRFSISNEIVFNVVYIKPSVNFKHTFGKYRVISFEFNINIVVNAVEFDKQSQQSQP